MSSETAPPPAPRLTLTEEAAGFVKERLAKEGRPNAALRIGVKGGGCNGLMYVFDYTDEPPRARDLVYEFYGTKVYIDDKSIDFVDGSSIVYENTLMFQGLKFKNPLEASTCGCGETFSVKQEVHEKRKKKVLPTSST